MPDENRSSDPLRVPLPDHIQIERDGANLVLDIRWFRPIHLAMLGFSLLWCGFLVFWYSTALSRPSPSNIMLWFPLLHVGVGLGLLYSAIAGLVNHTRITVGSGAVDVRLGPLPWWGARRVEASEIKQLFGEEVRSSTRSGTSSSYHVNAITTQDRKVRLVSGLAAADLALYLEQEIERALGISDRKVPGELIK